MIPRPVAIALALCDQVIIEEGTKKVSLIGCFSGIKVPEFPAAPRPFSVFASLTDALGNATIELTVTHLETDEEIYALQRNIPFPDRFTEVRVLFRIAECVFPEGGTYLFTLLADGEWIAHRRVRVYSPGDIS